MRTEMFSWKLVSGAPVSAGGLTITPQVRVLQVRFPWGGRWGAFVWNRPVAVLVERNGKQERLPIVDVTRVAQLVIMMFTLALSVVLRGRRDSNRKKEHKK